MKIKKILTAICAVLLLASITVTATLFACRKDNDDAQDGGEVTPKTKDFEVFLAKDTEELPASDSDAWKKPSHASILADVSFLPGTSAVSFVMAKNNASQAADFHITFKDEKKPNTLSEVIEVFAIPENDSDHADLEYYLVGTLSDIIQNRRALISDTVSAKETRLYTVIFQMKRDADIKYLEYRDLGTSLYVEYAYEIHAATTSIPTVHPDPPTIETMPPVYVPPESQFPQHISKKNYNDYFTLAVQVGVNPHDYFFENGTDDILDEALYTRHQTVREYLGVDIMATYAGSNSTYADAFTNSVLNKDGAYDALITHPNEHVADLVSGMYLQDISELPGVSMNDSYWNLDIMNELSINGNYYLGFSNINVPNTHVIAFSRKVLKSSSMSSEAPTEEELYDWVFSGNWTLDRFIDTVYQANPYMVYGLSGQQWVPWIGFLQGCNVNYVEYDSSEGAFQLSLMNEINKSKTEYIVKRLKALSSSGHCDLTFPINSSISFPNSSVINTEALMELVATKDLGSYKMSGPIGILPYPLYDSSQFDASSPSLGYRSLQWGGYLVVPSYLRNAKMTGEVLELMSSCSDGVLEAAFSKMLGEQADTTGEDTGVLSIVWNGICTDAGQAYAQGVYSPLYMIPKVTWTGEGGYDFASHYESVEHNANKEFLAFYKKVAKLSASQ